MIVEGEATKPDKVLACFLEASGVANSLRTKKEPDSRLHIHGDRKKGVALHSPSLHLQGRGMSRSERVKVIHMPDSAT